jgi:hypothetical protein
MDSRGRTRGGPLALTHELGRLGSSALGCYRSHSARSARSARSASALGDAPMSRPTPDDRISPSARYVTGSSAFPKADADRAGALRTLADVADGLRVSSLRSHRASSGIFVFVVRVLVSWGEGFGQSAQPFRLRGAGTPKIPEEPTMTRAFIGFDPGATRSRRAGSGCATCAISEISVGFWTTHRQRRGPDRPRFQKADADRTGRAARSQMSQMNSVRRASARNDEQSSQFALSYARAE